MTGPESASLVADARSLDRLQRDARAAPHTALRAAATQFEAVFVNMLIKSMREALPQDGPFASEATKLYTGMLDQQLAHGVASRGIGLAELIVKQLERHPSVSGGAAAAARAPQDGAARAVERIRDAARDAATTDGPQGFVDAMLPHAREAERQTGVPARFILGQAALESGWGRREIRAADGSPSYNLFGIKATRGWSGRTVETTTTEFVNGVAQKVVQRFRAYGSYAEAFADWARLLAANPRYAGVLANGKDAARFAQALQAAGYATDPNYAEKLTRVLNHSLLRQSFA
jgi:flagellar protein FlgJ